MVETSVLCREVVPISEGPVLLKGGRRKCMANLGGGDSTLDFAAVSTHDGAVGLDDSHGPTQSIVFCQCSCIGWVTI